MSKVWMLLSLLLVAAMALTIAGCGGDDDEATPKPTATGTGTETPEPTTQGYTGGKHTFKIAHTSQPNTSTQWLWELVDEKLRYYTDGQVELEIFPAASLYGTFDTWYALVTGALDIGSLGDFVPQAAGYMDFQIGYLNFFWGDTSEEVWAHDRRFWDHPDGGETMLGQAEAAGVKMLAVFPSGVVQVCMNRIGAKTMWDFKDTKFSTVGGLTGLFTEVAGATQIMIDPAEFSIAFQQGLIDVSATGPESALAQRQYESGKHALVVSALASHTFWGMNLKLWDSLSPELQDIIRNKVIPETMDWALAERHQAELDALKELEAMGVTLTYMDEAERIEFRDRAWVLGREKGFYKGMSEELMMLADRLRSEPYDQQELPFP